MKRTLLIILALFQFSCLWGQGESVVCLHGFFRSYKCLIPMSSALRSEGLDVYLWDYQSRRKTIEEHAEDLVSLLHEIAARKPGRPIHFVTHSLGGVITRAACAHPDCPDEAKMGKAVLLAPPNQGSKLARKFQNVKVVRWIFGEKSGAQLLDYDEEKMLTVGSFPTTMHVVVIAGGQGNPFLWREPNDGKVGVSETYLDTPHTHIIHHASHKWIMTSRWTIRFTKDFLVHDRMELSPDSAFFTKKIEEKVSTEQ